jgi:hypothetical protein
MWSCKQLEIASALRKSEFLYRERFNLAGAHRDLLVDVAHVQQALQYIQRVSELSHVENPNNNKKNLNSDVVFTPSSLRRQLQAELDKEIQ